MMRSNLLFNAFRGMEPSDAAGGDIQHLVNPLLMTIHVFFFPYYLSFTVDDTLRGAVPLAFRQTAYNIKWSQDILLAPPELPLVTHQGAIDIGLLYHMTNFWRFHIVLNEDSSIFNIFSRLPDDYKPRAPTRKLKNNKLSFKKNWVGAICE